MYFIKQTTNQENLNSTHKVNLEQAKTETINKPEEKKKKKKKKKHKRHLVIKLLRDQTEEK